MDANVQLWDSNCIKQVGSRSSILALSSQTCILFGGGEIEKVGRGWHLRAGPSSDRDAVEMVLMSGCVADIKKREGCHLHARIQKAGAWVG